MYRVMLLNSKVFPNSKVINFECDRYYYDKLYCLLFVQCTHSSLHSYIILRAAHKYFLFSHIETMQKKKLSTTTCEN